MKHRIFIAINLPQDIKGLLDDYQNNHKDVPAKWTAKENLHITVVFIGDIEDKDLAKLHKAVAETVKGNKQFAIKISSISYEPPTPLSGVARTLNVPRMIWASAEESANFTTLCDNLEKAIVSVPNLFFKPEKRKAVPHITLARIKEWEWRRIEPEERPGVEEITDYSLEIKSIELMESVLKKTGPEYKILETYNLK